MATGPKFPKTPLELLTPDLDREEPFINKFWGPAVCATLTFTGICFANYASKRPVFSGIHRHIIYSGAAGALGGYLDQYRSGYFAEKDAVLRHYIQLHPDDFPPFERQKYADVLLPWIPIR